MPNGSDLLDDVNRRLLAELHAEPRISMSELARRVGMPPPAVTDRVTRLQEAGVISGFRMDVDAAAFGLPITAFTRIRPTATASWSSSTHPPSRPSKRSSTAS